MIGNCIDDKVIKLCLCSNEAEERKGEERTLVEERCLPSHEGLPGVM